MAEEEELRGTVDVADFAAVGFVGLNMDATVGVPEADRAVLAAAEAVVTVAVESGGQNRALMALEHARLLPREVALAHLSRRSEQPPFSPAAERES